MQGRFLCGMALTRTLRRRRLCFESAADCTQSMTGSHGLNRRDVSLESLLVRDAAGRHKININ